MSSTGIQNTVLNRFPAFPLWLSYFIVFLGISVWRPAFNTLVVNELKLNAMQIGFLFSLAGLPGLLCAGVGTLDKHSRLLPLSCFSLLIMGGGLILTGTAFHWLILPAATLLVHGGYIIFYTTANAICLQRFSKESSLRQLSVLKSIGPLAAAFTGWILIFKSQALGGQMLMAASGILIFILGTGCWVWLAYSDKFDGSFFSPDRLRFRKALGSYYLLNFFNGCRSGIFKSFVLLHLTTQYGQFKFQHIALIFFMGNLLTFIGYQAVGHLGKKIPPLRLLAVLYLIISINFFCFSWVHPLPFLLALFFIDSLLFCTSAILDNHLNQTSRPHSILKDLSAGVSLYHLGLVLMPLLGGLIYKWDPGFLYILGSLLALSSTFIALNLQSRADTQKTNR